MIHALFTNMPAKKYTHLFRIFGPLTVPFISQTFRPTWSWSFSPFLCWRKISVRKWEQKIEERETVPGEKRPPMSILEINCPYSVLKMTWKMVPVVPSLGSLSKPRPLPHRVSLQEEGSPWTPQPQYTHSHYCAQCVTPKDEFLYHTISM